MGAAAAQFFFAAGTGEGRMQRGGRRKERCVVPLGCSALWTGTRMPRLDSENHKLYVKVIIARCNRKKKLASFSAHVEDFALIRSTTRHRCPVSTAKSQVKVIAGNMSV